MLVTVAPAFLQAAWKRLSVPSVLPVWANLASRSFRLCAVKLAEVGHGHSPVPVEPVFFARVRALPYFYNIFHFFLLSDATRCVLPQSLYLDYSTILPLFKGLVNPSQTIFLCFYFNTIRSIFYHLFSFIYI